MTLTIGQRCPKCNAPMAIVCSTFYGAVRPYTGVRYYCGVCYHTENVPELCEEVFPMTIDDRTPLDKDLHTVKVSGTSAVKSPKHYIPEGLAKWGLELIDITEALELPADIFNVWKYTCRAGKKDPTKEIEDLEKARRYLTFRIRHLKGEPVSDTSRKTAGLPLEEWELYR